jgi:hypothetical protein
MSLWAQCSAGHQEPSAGGMDPWESGSGIEGSARCAHGSRVLAFSSSVQAAPLGWDLVALARNLWLITGGLENFPRSACASDRATTRPNRTGLGSGGLTLSGPRVGFQAAYRTSSPRTPVSSRPRKRCQMSLASRAFLLFSWTIQTTSGSEQSDSARNAASPRSGSAATATLQQ